jgi:hypothetical protein
MGSRLALAVVCALPLALPAAGAQQPTTVKAVRFRTNPLITVRSSPSLGDNVNGPSIIRVPAWVKQPLGRYYMYFAHHMGHYIRLAYADALTGPWRIHEPGVLPVRDTAFFRPQPDPPENLENFYTHVASPEVFVDSSRQRLVMWFHGWFSQGKQFPAGDAAAREWSRKQGYGQFTQVAESSDGLRFDVRPAISRTSYLRLFQHDNQVLGMARLGLLLRARDPLAVFEAGPNPFRDTTYAGRVRHVALIRRGATLHVFFTGIGDAPERIMLSSIDLNREWTAWKAGEPADVLRPEAPYECPDLPNAPSRAGDVKGAVRQLRDPGTLEEDGRTYLFYSICGEQGIAGAEITFAGGQ